MGESVGRVTDQLSAATDGISEQLGSAAAAAGDAIQVRWPPCYPHLLCIAAPRGVHSTHYLFAAAPGRCISGCSCLALAIGRLAGWQTTLRGR